MLNARLRFMTNFRFKEASDFEMLSASCVILISLNVISKNVFWQHWWRRSSCCLPPNAHQFCLNSFFYLRPLIKMFNDILLPDQLIHACCCAFPPKRYRLLLKPITFQSRLNGKKRATTNAKKLLNVLLGGMSLRCYQTSSFLDNASLILRAEPRTTMR